MTDDELKALLAKLNPQQRNLLMGRESTAEAIEGLMEAGLVAAILGERTPDARGVTTYPVAVTSLGLRAVNMLLVEEAALRGEAPPPPIGRPVLGGHRFGTKELAIAAQGRRLLEHWAAGLIRQATQSGTHLPEAMLLGQTMLLEMAALVGQRAAKAGGTAQSREAWLAECGIYFDNAVALDAMAKAPPSPTDRSYLALRLDPGRPSERVTFKAADWTAAERYCEDHHLALQGEEGMVCGHASGAEILENLTAQLGGVSRG